jgi:hypothetical protein
MGDIQNNYTEVRGSQNWFYHSPETPGYGWDSATHSGSGPFNLGSDPNADLFKDRCNGSQAKKFSADVENGTYNLMLYFYWPSYDIDNEIIKAEGTEIYRFNLNRDNIRIINRLVTVNDGTLDLEFSDADSTGKRWLISGIDIKPLSDAVVFGPNSAQIAHPFMVNNINGPMVGRWSFALGFGAYADQFHYSRLTGAELVSGATIGTKVFNNVNYFKILIIETFNRTLATISMAQDTNGNVWVLKIYDHIGDATGDGVVSLDDPIFSLQVLSGLR